MKGQRWPENIPQAGLPLSGAGWYEETNCLATSPLFTAISSASKQNVLVSPSCSKVKNEPFVPFLFQSRDLATLRAWQSKANSHQDVLHFCRWTWAGSHDINQPGARCSWLSTICSSQQLHHHEHPLFLSSLPLLFSPLPLFLSLTKLPRKPLKWIYWKQLGKQR